MVSIIAIALSSMVMILTAAVVRGFKEEISGKVIGFGSHLQVSHYETRNNYESRPVTASPEKEKLRRIENVADVQAVVLKAGILRKKDLVQAIVIKGVEGSYDWSFFEDQIQPGGSVPDGRRNKILLSAATAKALDAKCGDEVMLYFIQDPPRLRKMTVCGIYETGFTQFDELIALADIGLLQRINGWDSSEVSALEVRLEDFSRLDESSDKIYAGISQELNSMTIVEKYPDIFNWLELQDINFIIIIALMILVSVVNAVSAIIILILEKGNTIGIFKSAGMRNSSLRRIFILQGIYLLLTGLAWGNLAGYGLCFLQAEFGLISLPVESYYIEYVPIKLEFSDFILINVSTAVVSIIALLLPSRILSRTEIVKVLKFD